MARTEWNDADATSCAEIVVKTCPVGQLWRSRRFREDLGFIEAENVSAVVAVDVLGPPTRNVKASSEYVFVAVEHFTRWVEVRTVLSPTREKIKEFLTDLMIKHGRIMQLVADSGSQFKSWPLSHGRGVEGSILPHDCTLSFVERTSGKDYSSSVGRI